MASIKPDLRKRGFGLPRSCKDLHDVLELGTYHGGRPSRTDLLRAFGIKVKDLKTVLTSLDSLQVQLQMMAESSAFKYALHLDSEDPQFDLSVSGGKDLPLRTSLSIETRTKRERILQEFCVRHALPLPEDTGTRAFCADLPASQFYSFELPSETSLAVKMVRALCEEVGGLNKDAPLCCQVITMTKIGGKAI